MNHQSSLIFRIGLVILRIFSRPYRFVKRHWPDFFHRHVDDKLNLDTSRMLRKFNFFHRMFFGRGFDTIRCDESELQALLEARQRGPVVYLMRNWGQVEYNYFNDLFLKKELPLVVHNNLVKMGHWMPSEDFWPMLFNKLDRFFDTGKFPYNSDLFDLEREIRAARPVLYALDLPRGNHWVEERAEEQKGIFQALLNLQRSIHLPIQLVPLHFIYDKHPGRENSLTDILFGERENPGYFRRMILFLRNYKKRAAAKIGTAIDFQGFLQTHEGIAEDRLVHHWVSVTQRAFDTEARQVTGPKLKSRKSIIEDVLENPKVRQRIRNWADEQNQTFDIAEKKVRTSLWEIASDIRFTMIELWNYFLGWFFNSLYSGVVVDEAGALKAKQIAKDSPLVLVPCHKSHVDYMLLSYVFYHRNMSLPLICAGNNLNFWPVGPMFRRSGAYFIRRSFDNDELYPLALKGYVGELLREGYFQEFFIEGTRSRSGKLFPPKVGLLKMILETFLEEDLRDVYFVPISISYDRVLEEKSYLKEIKGAKKQGEKFSDLFRLPRFLKRRYGKIYVQFAEPISLAAHLKQAQGLEASDAPRIDAISKDLARDILREINSVTTLLPAGLAATVLLASGKRSVTFDEILVRYEQLLTLASGARQSENLREHPTFSLEEILEQFSKDGLIQEHEDGEERFFTLRDDTRPHLDFFKNTAIHFYGPFSLDRLCRQAAARAGSSDSADLWGQITALLNREFFFPENEIPANPDVPEWLSRAVEPILEAYWLALKALDRIDLEKIEQKTLTRKILEVGEIFHLRGSLHYPESLSQFTLGNAVQVLQERGILRNYAAEMGAAGRKIYGKGPEFESKAKLEKLLNQLLDR